ncbi:MAG: hypothetical protein GY799_21380 [Desulfobulbaceae bacterium]|nr:hypothetical protein [Desulfobulbaceae bacterium]
MPVTFDEGKGKWCMGSQCNYDSKKDAEAAMAAYHANLNKSEIKILNVDIAKSAIDDKRIFKCVVLRPEQYDNDGEYQDYYSVEVVEKACHDFNIYCSQNNVQHLFNTDLVKVAESYVADVGYELGDGEVKAGDWVMAVKVLDDDIWSLCKDGTFTGFSIGCEAKVEIVDD